jgi:hypothetical protein
MSGGIAQIDFGSAKEAKGLDKAKNSQYRPSNHWLYYWSSIALHQLT